MDICSSPLLIAAYHVFHRLLVPRHPPCALCSLTLHFTFVKWVLAANFRLPYVGRYIALYLSHVLHFRTYILYNIVYYKKHCLDVWRIIFLWSHHINLYLFNINLFTNFRSLLQCVVFKVPMNRRFIPVMLWLLSGDKGIRTLDPLLARQVLSQLSYTPILYGLYRIIHFLI